MPFFLQAQRGEDVQGEVVRVVFRQGEVVVVRGDAAVGVDVFPAVCPLDGDVGEFALAVRDAVAVFEGLLPGVAD